MSRIKMALCGATLALGLAFAVPSISQAAIPTVYQPPVLSVDAAYQPVAFRSSHYGYRGHWHCGYNHWHRYYRHCR